MTVSESGSVKLRKHTEPSEKRGRCKEKATVGERDDLHYKLISSCVVPVFISHQKTSVNHKAFLHPPLIQLHLAKSTRQTKPENFVTVGTQRVFVIKGSYIMVAK